MLLCTVSLYHNIHTVALPVQYSMQYDTGSTTVIFSHYFPFRVAELQKCRSAREASYFSVLQCLYSDKNSSGFLQQFSYAVHPAPAADAGGSDEPSQNSSGASTDFPERQAATPGASSSSTSATPMGPPGGTARNCHSTAALPSAARRLPDAMALLVPASSATFLCAWPPSFSAARAPRGVPPWSPSRRASRRRAAARKRNR